MLSFEKVVVVNRNCEFTANFTGITAVLGPNGAGKSTLLALAAGALRPDSGTLKLDDRVLVGSASFVPSHRRRIAYLEQRALLFPHLNVLRNVSFGADGQRARAELAAVGCLELADRRPDQLSGGQAQRVALARALAVDPLVVLLDEPMAALDAAAVPELRMALRDRLTGRPALLATHDLLDVLTIADRVAVLEGGQIVEHGPVADVLARPQSRFLAEFTGVNLLTGLAVDGGLLVEGVKVAGLASSPVPAGAPALATLAPNAVALHRLHPGGSPRNDLTVIVESLEPRGATVLVRTLLRGQPLAAELTAAAVADLALMPGDEVFAVVKATQVQLYGK